MYRELRPAAFHPLSIAQACRELLLILRCWRIIRFLLLTRWVFSAFRCQCQAFTSSFWIRYFTKWSLLGKRECVTRSFSVAFHHTLANSQLWAVLDDSRSGWRDVAEPVHQEYLSYPVILDFIRWSPYPAAVRWRCFFGRTIMNNVIFDWYLSRQKFIQRPLPRCNRQSP